MNNRKILPIIFLCIVGCNKKQQAPSITKIEEPANMRQAEIPIKIGDNREETPHLSFRITAIHQNRTPTAEFPFHVTGGDWTFIDCVASATPNVNFIVGIHAKRGDGVQPISWGKAILAVKDRATGIQFVELFNKVFAGKSPSRSNPSFLPKPLAINTAIFGDDMGRENEGGFNSSPGDWTATKWFPETEGESGELYFNYNLKSRIGEFSEKDSNYADSLAEIFVTAFRDGPKPERTPQNDPNITLDGPRIGKPIQIISANTSHFEFSPNGQYLIYQAGSKIHSLSVKEPNAKPTLVAECDNSPWAIKLLDDGMNLIVQEGIPEAPGSRSSSDPMKIWWIEGKTKLKTLLRGPEKDINLVESPVSPDHRYIVLSQWQGNFQENNRRLLLHILDRQSNKWCECASKEALSIVGWKKTELGMRFVAITNRYGFEKNTRKKVFFVDPLNGKLELQQNESTTLDAFGLRSPDGKYIATLGSKDLILTEIATEKKRKFIFHEDDHRFIGPESIEWVSPGYLKFFGAKLAFI